MLHLKCTTNFKADFANRTVKYEVWTSVAFCYFVRLLYVRSIKEQILDLHINILFSMNSNQILSIIHTAVCSIVSLRIKWIHYNV